MNGRLGLLLAVAMIVGCGSRPQGPLDSRLYGSWESRRDFVSSDTLDFKSDGSLKVTASDGKTSKSYTAQWYVKESGDDEIKINMQAQGKQEFRVRRIKFLNDGSFEMKEGNKILGRFGKKK